MRQQQRTGLAGLAGFLQTRVLHESLHWAVQPRVWMPLDPTNLVRVADVRTAVTGIPHAITIFVLLITVGNFLAVVQDVFYSYEKGVLP